MSHDGTVVQGATPWLTSDLCSFLLTQEGLMASFSVRMVSSLGGALLLGAALTLAGCSNGALGPEQGAEGRRSAGDDGTPFYYYDHQPIYLKADSSCMVVLPSAALSSDSASVRAAVQLHLARHGLQMDAMRPMGPPPFNWLVGLSGNVGAAAAAAARAELLDAAEFRSVIPAYRTLESDLPLYVLNRVVAKFKEGVSRGQIDNLLGSLGAEVVAAQDIGKGYVTYLIEPSRGSRSDVLGIANAIDESSIALWGAPDMIDPMRSTMSLAPWVPMSCH